MKNIKKQLFTVDRIEIDHNKKKVRLIDESSAVSRDPKMLFFDIETAGMNGFKADLAFVISISYVWDNDKIPVNIQICDFPLFKKDPHDDSELLRAFHKILDKAEVISAHFGEKFDRKFLNARFKRIGLPRTSPVRLVDTWRVAKTHLLLSSNRLDNLAKFLKCKNRKMQKGDFWPNGWYEYLKGSSKARSLMKKYNNQDVLTQRECALKLRDYWPDSTRFYNRYRQKDSLNCRICDSSHLIFRGYGCTKTSKYRRIQCTACGSWDTRSMNNSIKVIKLHKK